MTCAAIINGVPCGGERLGTVEGSKVKALDGSTHEEPFVVTPDSPCGACGEPAADWLPGVKCRGVCRAVRCADCAAL